MAKIREYPFSRRTRRISFQDAATLALASSGQVEGPMFRITRIDRFGADGYIEMRRTRKMERQRQREQKKADIKAFLDQEIPITP